PAKAVVRVEFSEPIDPMSLSTSSVQVRERLGYTQIPVQVTLDASGRVLVVTPLQPLFAGVLHDFTLFSSVTDLTGNRLSQGQFTGDFSSSFTVAFAGDTTPPTVLATEPADGATG